MTECLERYRPLVWSLARRFTWSNAEAEDAAQDVFVALWRSAGRFDEATAPEPAFVATIARRRLIDRLRRARRRPLAQSIDDTLASADGGLEARGEALFAARAVAQLRPAQRAVLVLSACEGMSHSEIAAALDLPLGTVKAHARRALARVRALLCAPPREACQPC